MRENSQAVVSVIVPIYNTASYVAECIRSIIEQSYKNIEIILVDDGSDDESGSICQSFSKEEKRIHYIRQENQGVVQARRSGVAQASGEYLLFLDSDDWIEQDMIAYLAEHIGSSDLITAGVFYDVRDGLTTEYKDQYQEGIYSGREMEELLSTMLYDEQSDELQRLTPWIGNKLYRTGIVRDIFEELDASMSFAEDAAFLYRYFLRCRSVAISHKCFYHYRYRAESACHRTNPNMLCDINKAYLGLIRDFREHPLRKILLKQLQHWVIIMTLMALNGQMGFENLVQIPEFLLDTDGLSGKKIVLYGAGKMGRDYRRQLIKMGYSIVLWVDSHCSDNQDVSPSRDILNTDYDVILVAVSKLVYAEDIIAMLLDMGINREKIVWKRPVRIN